MLKDGEGRSWGLAVLEGSHRLDRQAVGHHAFRSHQERRLLEGVNELVDKGAGSLDPTSIRVEVLNAPAPLPLLRRRPLPLF